MADQRPHADPSLRPWDPRLQKQRGDYLMSLVRKAARSFFSEAGECLVSDQVDFDCNHKRLPTGPSYLRERVNCVTALMAGDDQDVACGNLVLSRLMLDPATTSA